MSERYTKEVHVIKPDPKYDGVEETLRADRCIKINGVVVEEFILENGESRVFVDDILCSSTYAEAIQAVAGYKRGW